MFVVLLLIYELIFGLNLMTEDLQHLTSDKDTSRSCVFTWPDRPIDSLPPNPPTPTPYNPLDDWPFFIPPIPNPIPTDDNTPIPGSTPKTITGFDIALFHFTGFIHHVWYSKILISGLAELSTQFAVSDLSPISPFYPPNTGFIYGLGTNGLNAAVGINCKQGFFNNGFVNFRRLKQLYPGATGFIVDYFVGHIRESSPENCNFGVDCYTGVTVEEDDPEWFVNDPTVGVDGDARTNSAVGSASGFRKVIKIVYTVSTSSAIFHTKNSPI